MQFFRHLLVFGTTWIASAAIAAPPFHYLYPPAPHALQRQPSTPSPAYRSVETVRRVPEKTLAEHTLVIDMDVQQPLELTIETGDSVTWLNQDEAFQTITAEYEIFDSGKLAPGDSFTRIFTRPGTYPFYSRLDQQLYGVIRVE